MAWLERLDRLVLRLEQAACVLALAAMAALMGASVVHRVASRPEGRLSTALLASAHALGLHPDPALVHGPAQALLLTVLSVALLYLALRSRSEAGSRRRTWLLALGLTALGALAVQAVLALLPSGIVWAPAVSLACMLWAGLLGASIAAAQGRHLSLDVGGRLWPARWRPHVRTVTHLLTAATCALLCVLAFRSVHEHFLSWQRSHDAAILLPTRLPLWAVLAVLPWSFAVMSLRFLRHAGTGEGP